MSNKYRNGHSTLLKLLRWPAAVALVLVNTACGDGAATIDASTGSDAGDAGDAGVSGGLEWQRSTGSSFPLVAADENGGLAIAGNFIGSIDVGGGTLTADSLDLFVARLGLDGVHRSSASFGGGGIAVPLSMDVDAQDQMVVAGYYRGVIDFGGGALPEPPGGKNRGFVARYLASGLHQRSVSLDSLDHTSISSVDVASDQALLAAGTISAQSSLLDVDVEAIADVASPVILRLEPTVEATNFGGLGPAASRVVQSDGLGGAFYAGLFDDAVAFGSETLTVNGRREAFVARLGADNSPQWAIRLGSAPGSDIEVIALLGNVDSSGNLIIVLSFLGRLTTPDGASYTSQLTEDLFLAKVSPSGDLLFSTALHGDGSSRPQGLAVGPAGEIAVVGSFSGTASFGGELFLSRGDSDIFLAVYDGEGEHLSSRTFGGEGPDGGLAVTFADSGALVMSASFRGSVDFGGPEILSSEPNQNHGVVLKYAP